MSEERGYRSLLPGRPPRARRDALLVLATLALSLPPVLAAGVQEQQSVDPESTEAGRDVYLGREVARTMHWLGAEWLLRETREKEENASLLLANLGIEEGQTVCDFGCGNGYYTLPIAKMVGSEGRVIAVDLQPEMLGFLVKRTAAAGIGNVVPVEATLTNTGLEPASCDSIVLVDVYHEVSHPVTVLAGLRQALKPGGRLILAEFRTEDPEVPIKRVHKMSKAQILLEMSANGFQFDSEFDGLPWQHLMSFTVDPEFPRKKGQDQANGRAVAAGFERALRSGDGTSLPGFYFDELSLRPGSRLLGDDEEALTLSRREFRDRLGRHVEEVGLEVWRGALADIELEVRGETEPGRVLDDPTLPRTLILHATWPQRKEPYDPGARWDLSRDSAGRWLVRTEEFTH